MVGGARELERGPAGGIEDLAREGQRFLRILLTAQFQAHGAGGQCAIVFGDDVELERFHVVGEVGEVESGGSQRTLELPLQDDFGARARGGRPDLEPRPHDAGAEADGARGVDAFAHGAKAQLLSIGQGHAPVGGVGPEFEAGELGRRGGGRDGWGRGGFGLRREAVGKVEVEAAHRDFLQRVGAEGGGPDVRFAGRAREFHLRPVGQRHVDPKDLEGAVQRCRDFADASGDLRIRQGGGDALAQRVGLEFGINPEDGATGQDDEGTEGPETDTKGAGHGTMPPDWPTSAGGQQKARWNCFHRAR